MEFERPAGYGAGVRRVLISFAVALAAVCAAPAVPAVPSFILVNGTDGALTDISISRFGAQDWRPLGVALPGPRMQVTVNFSDPDCAFDIRARIPGGSTAVWRGVNLCEVKTVILNREPSGELWVDYA